MARTKPKELMSKLADVGEEAMAKVAETPGLGRMVEGAAGMKSRLDELQLKMRGLEGIEKRVQDLERQVAQLKKERRAQAKPPAAKPPKPAAKPAPKPKPGPDPGP